MSIYNKKIEDIQQIFNISNFNKHTYGEVNTDFILINKMLDMLPKNVFTDKNKKWLDPCCGKGYFPIVLYFKLFKSLQKTIPNSLKRHNHIIENMIYMIEINKEHIDELFELFGEKANIINDDFLNVTNQKYDIIMGNPPFNVNGIVKVPTQKNISKKTDGKMIWGHFTLHAIDFLKENGFLVFITPSIWMKHDHFMYSKILKYKIEKLNTMTNTETNTAFHGQAQTPTCYFLLKKQVNNDKNIYLYDKITQKYISYNLLASIPLFASSLFKKISHFITPNTKLKVKKTNMPSKKVLFSPINKKNFTYKNIKTCKLNKLSPFLDINFSNIPCRYDKIPKIVMAHKMYGFPFYDEFGEYGISNRDNYVIYGREKIDMIKLQQFFSTKTALYLFEGTRYRMKYLEKYVFDLIPDITKIENFPKIINDDTIANYFKFTQKEKDAIKTFHKKKYNFFI